MFLYFPDEKVTLQEFLKRVSDLGFMAQLRFYKDRPDADESMHDFIFIVNMSEPNKGAHVARTCACCEGNFSINPYENFENSFSYNTYFELYKLLRSFATTPVAYKLKEDK